MDDSTTVNDRRSMWSMIKDGYEGLVMTVIRPLRAQYAPADLGPTRALIQQVVTHRVDIKLKNSAGLTIECSWWKPKLPGPAAPGPCIVILHGNSSCRLGGLEIVTHAIPAGFSVFALDFAGSGLSQGKYVSLGYHEQGDIATAVKYLRKSGETSSICLWGRSMGAVAALLYVQSDPQINAMVLDSPFSSLPQLAVELVDEGKLGVPKIAVKLVMRLIRSDIRRRAKFDMFKLKPISKIHKCTTPAFFVVGLQDELVGPHHVEALYKLHNGPNQLFKFSGGHNSPRPTNFFIEALQFLRVMVGLMPLSAAEASRCSPKKKNKAAAKVFKNPLELGVSIEAVHKMNVKELKAAIDRAGYSDVTCIEKKEMVELVLKLYARYIRTAQPYSQDDLSVPTRVTPAPAPPAPVDPAVKSDTTASSSPSNSPMKNSPVVSSTTSEVASLQTVTPNTTYLARRYSEGSIDLHEEEDEPTADASAHKPTFLPSALQSSSTSVISDSDLTRGLSMECPSDEDDRGSSDSHHGSTDADDAVDEEDEEEESSDPTDKKSPAAR